jgi:hypothetical protein
MTDEVETFVSWLREESVRLRNAPVEDAAEGIAERLEQIDSRLGIELAKEPESGEMDLIVTAYSNEALFAIVRDLTSRLVPLPGWRVTALKPARGFDFDISFGKHTVRASELRWRELADVPHGFALIAPQQSSIDIPSGSDGEELAWLVVETGLGEELASRIEHLEFSRTGQARSLPIESLTSRLQRLR